jgi:hypothetical protein
MPAETISTASPIGQAVDSLSANEFAVELEGVTAKGIFRVSGLVTFKLDVKPSLTKVVRDPLKIVKMVQRDPELPFNRWVRESVQAKDDIVRPLRTLEVVALDDGVETRRWKIKGAWISEISYSDFDSGSSELIQETLIIQYEDVEETWMSKAIEAAASPGVTVTS